MDFLNKLTRKASELKEKTQDRIKANGGLEGILQKTSEQVDKLATSAGEGIKKATNETKQYIQNAKESAQEQGKEGFIGVATTLGSKVGNDVSNLVQTGYQRIANSEIVQNLKKEIAEEKEQAEKQSPSIVDTYNTINLTHIFTYFFSGVKKGNEWTTASQPNNPKNEKLIKVTYVVNGNEWFNVDTQESGSGAFDLTLDFLIQQTGLDINDKESSKQLVMKTQDMMNKLVSQLEQEAQEEAQKVAAAKKQDEQAKTVPAVKETTTVKKPSTRKPAAKKVVNNVAVKTPAAKKVSVKTTTPAVKKPAAKKVATKKPAVKTASKTVKKTEE